MADSTSKTDQSSEPTQSVSSTDASTTQGRAAAGTATPQGTPSSAGGAATAQQDQGVTRVQVEQAPKEPDVLYDGENLPKREHVRADYQPFEW
ncbi:hypothetical protein SEA_CAMBIARE_65 [Mycobacterium phage Cambiare]|uniref:Uncharacterized protein n=1 Tax=Mycobacterium phage Cambiare TaxID=1647305 RepID=A0A0F6SJP3_9CAUD|nr:hypothetical protein AVT48_gp65 [Mycobacterium phage Cambiare]AKF14567.1 hypothetical protein SEA_CAMBIARE_65 [Mycobacterium phage Cambiare]